MTTTEVPEDLGERTKRFSLRVVRLVEALPKTTSAETIGKQLIRSGTSVAANYRAARRGRSKAEFIAKLGIVEEEADETVLWLELFAESGIVKPELVEPLREETEQILRIVVSSIRTAKSNLKSSI